jgi:hypothetical protein
MSAYKQLLTSDIIVTPFEVHKDFTFTGGNSLVDPSVGIDRLLGQNLEGTLFDPDTDPTTGNLGTQYQRQVYSSIRHLYYTNYLSCSYGDTANLQILIPGRDSSGDVFIGASESTQYYNYPQTTLSYPRYYPTSFGAYIGAISIPARLFGDYINPNTFVFSNGVTRVLTDDGEGNILYNNEIVGNIFYPHGIITITSASLVDILGFINSSDVTCSFQSSYTIHETQYKCTIRESEFNYTLNPSTFTTISSSLTVYETSQNLSFCEINFSSSTTPVYNPGIPYGYVTESYFSPFITTVGLYDEQQNLLAIGKLAQPLPVSPTTDTTILINIDR